MAGAYEAFSLGLGDPVPLLGRARRGPGRPVRCARPLFPRSGRGGRGSGGRGSGQAASGRHRRPAQRRQVDADQPHDRRGAPAHRPRGRHHARLHLASTGDGAAGRSSSSTRPACASARASRTSSRSFRSPTPCAPCASPRSSSCCSTRTIPFEKQDLSIVDLVEQEGRALVIGINKWDLVADQPGLLKELEGEGCAPSAAGAGRAGRAALGPRRRGASTG